VNYYPHHIGDFNNATRHLNRIERSVYRDLIELYYDTEQPLSLDLKSLCRKIIARSDEEVAAVQDVLNEFFEHTENGWAHGRCDEEIRKAQEASEESNGRRENERERQRRHRERRKQLFAVLRDKGIVPPWDTATEALQKMVDNVMSQPVTRDVTANQEPLPITQDQDPKGTVVDDSTVVGSDEPEDRTAPASAGTAAQTPAPALPAIPEPPTEIGHWCNFFLREGFDAERVHTVKFRSKCGEWATAGVTQAQMREAMLCGDTKNGGRPDSPMWYANFVNEVLNPPKPKNSGNWWSTPEAKLAKAMEVGAGPARAGESDDAWTARIRVCIDNGGKPPVPKPAPVVTVATPEPVRVKPSPELAAKRSAELKALTKPRVTA